MDEEMEDEAVHQFREWARITSGLREDQKC